MAVRFTEVLCVLFSFSLFVSKYKSSFNKYRTLSLSLQSPSGLLSPVQRKIPTSHFPCLTSSLPDKASLLGREGEIASAGLSATLLWFGRRGHTSFCRTMFIQAGGVSAAHWAKPLHTLMSHLLASVTPPPIDHHFP